MHLRYTAIKGRGAEVNGRPIRASSTADLTRSMVSLGDYAVGQHAAEKNSRRLGLTAVLAARVERVRMFGTAALDLAWVAEGRTDAAIILGNKAWDTAAGVLIAREAGARVTDAAGHPHTMESPETIAAAPAIANALLAVLTDVDDALGRP